MKNTTLEKINRKFDQLLTAKYYAEKEIKHWSEEIIAAENSISRHYAAHMLKENCDILEKYDKEKNILDWITANVEKYEDNIELIDHDIIKAIRDNREDMLIYYSKLYKYVIEK